MILAAIALIVGCGDGGTDEAYRQDIEEWHAARIERLSAPDGWLTLVGLHPLQDGENTIGTDEGNDIRLNAYAEPDLGVIEVAEDGIVYRPLEGANIRIEGRPVQDARPVPLVTDAEGEPTVVETGTVSFHVVVRGGRPYLRVKDSANETRRQFEGIERFPVDARWRVTARLVSEDAPDSVMITDILGNDEPQPSPGELVFELDGREHRLTPVAGPGEPLFIVFGDATNGKSTYGGGRFLTADAPGSDGTVILDFNKAVNPPCVFTPYATCPLPPIRNELEIAVKAGEKAWRGHH